MKIGRFTRISVEKLFKHYFPRLVDEILTVPYTLLTFKLNFVVFSIIWSFLFSKNSTSKIGLREGHRFDYDIWIIITCKSVLPLTPD